VDPRIPGERRANPAAEKPISSDNEDSLHTGRLTRRISACPARSTGAGSASSSRLQRA
jgi:hypothetical protein